MYKVLSTVFILLITQSAFALEGLEHLIPTHDLVKAQLWHEGIQLKDMKSNTYASKKELKPLPEEILIPLDQLDS